MSVRLNQEESKHITVIAPARLHMGFFDLGATLGRRFGSIGVGLNEIYTRLEATPAEDWSVEGDDSGKVLQLAEKMAAALQISQRASIRLHETIPEHSGLGSGTQLALAVGMAIAKLHGLSPQVREVAALMGRGARSGIGIAVFEQGGLIVDGGRSPHTSVPPLISRLPMPDSWRFILVLDERDQGLSGQNELKAFKTLPEFPKHLSAHICHLILMQALPAVTENDLEAFGAAISEIQALIGDHFAPAQGGRYTSSIVGDAVAYLARQGAVATGQSSWGPTGFCMVDDPAKAESLLMDVQRYWGTVESLRFMLATPRNLGAEVTVQ